MRIGVMVGEGSGAAPDVDALAARARRSEELGLHTVWIANIVLDAISASAAVGRETSRIEIGTAVVPTYTRHPLCMAQEASTAQAACGGRFTLGIGLSHKVLIEGVLGLSYDKPARHMREYLEVLGPLVRGEAVNHEGESYTAHAAGFSHSAPVPVLVAALGPAMLRLAGGLTAGTITWATGSKTLERYVGPRLRAAAREAGRPEPRIVAGFPIVVTSDPERARRVASEVFAIYRTLPSYRNMLDREGVDGLAELALVGDESRVEAELRQLRDAGVTDFCAFVFKAEEGSWDRTLELLAHVAES